MALLLRVYGALCVLFWTSFVAGLHGARELVRRPRVQAWTERVTGAALIGLGAGWPPEPPRPAEASATRRAGAPSCA